MVFCSKTIFLFIWLLRFEAVCHKLAKPLQQSKFRKFSAYPVGMVLRLEMPLLDKLDRNVQLISACNLKLHSCLRWGICMSINVMSQQWRSKIPRSELTSLQQAPEQKGSVAPGAGPTGASGCSGTICRNWASPATGLSRWTDLWRWAFPTTDFLNRGSMLADLPGTSVVMQRFCILINFSLWLRKLQLYWLLTEWIIGKISSCHYKLSPHPLTRFLFVVVLCFLFIYLFCITLSFSLIWISG